MDYFIDDFKALRMTKFFRYTRQLYDRMHAWMLVAETVANVFRGSGTWPQDEKRKRKH